MMQKNKEITLQKESHNQKKLMISILSLSLLTVMAGAAMAPALGVIQAYFSQVDTFYIQMIISVPAVFIVITNFLFSRLAARFDAKTLVMAGLLLYTVGGCIAGLFESIWLVLIMRALVGIGVGIIMPLSTGLLAYYFLPEQQEGLMGYSSAMNQMGGVVATLLSGLLATVSWRVSFLVYLLGGISIVLCLLFLPAEDMLSGNNNAEDGHPEIREVCRKYYPFMIAMFLLMSTFFIYPANFAMETIREGVIPPSAIALIMAGMDFVAFMGGLLFVKVKAAFGRTTRFVAPVLFLCGYLLLAGMGGWTGTILGSICIGFANGMGIPFLISEVSLQAGRTAGTTVLPLVSAALYAAQFLSPFILSFVNSLFGGLSVMHLSYCFGAVLAAIFTIWSVGIPTE